MMRRVSIESSAEEIEEECKMLNDIEPSLLEELDDLEEYTAQNQESMNIQLQDPFSSRGVTRAIQA